MRDGKFTNVMEFDLNSDLLGFMFCELYKCSDPTCECNNGEPMPWICLWYAKDYNKYLTYNVIEASEIMRNQAYIIKMIKEDPDREEFMRKACIYAGHSYEDVQKDPLGVTMLDVDFLTNKLKNSEGLLKHLLEENERELFEESKKITNDVESQVQIEIEGVLQAMNSPLGGAGVRLFTVGTDGVAQLGSNLHVVDNEVDYDKMLADASKREGRGKKPPTLH